MFGWVGLSPIDAAILANGVVAVGTALVEPREDGVCEEDALGVFLKVFHEGSIRLRQLGVIGQWFGEVVEVEHCLSSKIFRGRDMGLGTVAIPAAVCEAIALGVGLRGVGLF